MESKEVILINKSDSLVIFYDCQSLKTKEIRKRNSIEFAEKIKKIILKRLPQINISIGIGNFYSGISGLRSSYNESYRAIKMGKKIYKENGIYHYDDLGIFKVLVELENDQVLKEYREEILGPLLNEANKDLIDTVKALLEHMGNKSEAAEELNIHRNSLNYRINKFSKLLDIDLENSENWLKIFLALKINEIL
jgi:purine catabolism regulator